MLEEFKQLPIWQIFDKKNKNNYNIDQLASSAISLLDLYYKAFPKYTLHNKQHQKNILRIIGELLGNEIEKLTSLECAIIILTVLYHDIGMVFNDHQLKNIETEEGFNRFLENNFKAKLAYQENKASINEELAEWYCRWMHAERVWIFLDGLDKTKWGSISLRETVGNICESHNHDTFTLNNDAKFNTDFLTQADLRFCAILLRLGDILDFDNSRTPKSVYEFLELDSPKNKNEQLSSVEWNKHLCSDGFRISHTETSVDLKFIAGPEHPQIEKNIQIFLDLIEGELNNCIGVVNKCSKRWRDFRLPSSIDRTSIQSFNYKKGDYRLSLDENQIIKLLIGENLYDNKFVFIRELLQNAIDTSRMREFHELSNGNYSFKIRPIEVSSWIDKKGYRWVRVDDFGMGINDYVIITHLLKKGNSYYNSDYFKIQKRHFKDRLNRDFTPISRFGIGLLSCFILGDSIEINTRAIAVPQTNSEEEKIRLSIQGIQSQYFIQTEKDKHSPLVMPKQYSEEKGYRKEIGTSIAIRIKRSEDNLSFERNLFYTLQQYVTCSPVQINYLGNKLGVDFDHTMRTPLALTKFYPFNTEQKNEIEQLIDKKLTSDIGVEVIGIDITSLSKSENLKGQIVIFSLKCEGLNLTKVAGKISFGFNFHEPSEIEISIRNQISNNSTHKLEDKEVNIGIQKIFESAVDLEHFNKIFLSNIDYHEHKYYRKGLRIIHNGINVPNTMDEHRYASDPKLEFDNSVFSLGLNAYSDNYTCFGIIYLQDSLIPNLSIARNVIKRFDFNIYSSLFFATKSINGILKNQFYNYFSVSERFSFKEIKEDQLIKEKVWDSENLILTENGLTSVNDIKQMLSKGVIKINLFSKQFISYLVRGLVQINFNAELIIDQTGNSHLAIISSKKASLNVLNEPVEDFYPLLFISFNDSNLLAHKLFINQKHCLSKWILSNQDYLADNHNGYFTSLIRFILDYDINAINNIIIHFNAILSDNHRPGNITISENDFPPKKIGY